MFLRSLKIQRLDKTIRQIEFHKGINLIVDETSNEHLTTSGNSVGKTSVLKLIDYCLDGDVKNIVMDPEFKRPNKLVENFLKDVVVTLSLTKDLDSDTTNDLIICRNFLTKHQRIQSINGEKCTAASFSGNLKQVIFQNSAEKPSFRQLISKNIRDAKHKLLNTINVLAPNVTTDVAYEALHLFWFGVKVDSSKDALVRKKNAEEKFRQQLRKEANPSQITQSIHVIHKAISKLELSKSDFHISDTYEEDLARLNNIRPSLSKLSTELSRLKLRRDLILESKSALESKQSEVDIAQVKQIYSEAGHYIENLQVSFESTVEFHNSVLEKRIKFITEELPEIENTLLQIKENHSKLIDEESQLAKAIDESDSVSDLREINDELKKLYEQKGAFEKSKSLWESSNKRVKELDERLSKIATAIDSEDELVQKRISEFNDYFSVLSRRLGGEPSVLSADNPDGFYKFDIGNIEGNPGTGAKKSQMAAFDLAYIQFADKIELPCLHFILQDQIENVHSNQITSLLTNIVSDINCQYILPILRDKLPSDLDVSTFEILSLSQKDKLLRIEKN